MSIFQIVKDNISTRQAVESYGIKVGRNGMACCPFHDDSSPSMKVDNRYFCFGCGDTGDVIDFVAKYFGLSSYEAATKLASDFGLNYAKASRSPPIRPLLKRKSEEQLFKENMNHIYCVYSDYYHLLKHWKEKYAQQDIDSEWNPKFIEALQNITRIEYLLDTILSGSMEDKAELFIDCGKEIKDIERRITESSTREADAVALSDGTNEFGRNSRRNKKNITHNAER